MLAQNNRKQTAWHVAAKRSKVEILDKLWEWAKEGLNRDVLSNNLLLAKNDDEDTALHLTLHSGNVQTLERIWNLAKEQLSREELNKFLLDQDNRRIFAWHVAAEWFKVEIAKLIKETLFCITNHSVAMNYFFERYRSGLQNK